jgi:hypothetical protein
MQSEFVIIIVNAITCIIKCGIIICLGSATSFVENISVIFLEPKAAFRQYALLLRNFAAPLYTGAREFTADFVHACIPSKKYQTMIHQTHPIRHLMVQTFRIFFLLSTFLDSFSRLSGSFI